jgi:heat shock gene repressor HrcA
MDERRAAILRAVVEGYIETAQPVGSAAVARDASVSVSSATIRNEMAALEQEGYLVQPHTSAGRIPTDKGYRHFVDSFLPAPGPLDAGRRQQVSSFFAKAHGALEDMLQSTSKLLTNLTDYAAVVVGPSREEAKIRSVQVVGLASRVALAVAVLENGVVEKATIDLADDVGDERLNAATAHLSGGLVGSTLGTAEVAASGDQQLDDVCKAAINALRTAHSEEPSPVYVGGASRMAAAFDAVETGLGPVDLLVNNSGTAWGAPAEQMPLQAWQRVMEVNATGAFLCSRELGRRLIARAAPGAILNIASIAGLRGSPAEVLDAVGYSASKGALVALTRDLAVKWARHGIRVNALAPGFFPTRMTEAVLAQGEQAIARSIPLGRVGAEGELMGSAVFLLSPAAAYITGQVLAVDGGMTAA